MTVALRTLGDEFETPKYAHVERERRWRVDPELRPELDDVPYVVIEDRYIRGTRLRLRRMTAQDVQSHKLTKKYEAADPQARLIVTAYLTPAEHALLVGLDADPLAKRRYRLAFGGLGWSLDRFTGTLEGLELLEVEAPDAAVLGALRAPLWAGAEITTDPRFEGGTLAAQGLPEDQSCR
jgi:CYTH domain-containing protein